MWKRPFKKMFHNEARRRSFARKRKFFVQSFFLRPSAIGSIHTRLARADAQRRSYVPFAFYVYMRCGVTTDWWHPKRKIYALLAARPHLALLRWIALIPVVYRLSSSGSRSNHCETRWKMTPVEVEPCRNCCPKPHLLFYNLCRAKKRTQRR